MTNKITLGTRPDFITADDITRWRAKVKLFGRKGSGPQRVLARLVYATPAITEAYYAGEWLGEQLLARGIALETARSICRLHGTKVGHGADCWAEAIEALSETPTAH